jgi:hypothetical protein
MKKRIFVAAVWVCLVWYPFFFARAETAETIVCPHCPDGCVPTVVVDRYRSKISEIRICAPGCVYEADVARLKRHVVCREVPTATPSKGDAKGRGSARKKKKKKKKTRDHNAVTAHRIIFSPTALPVPTGEVLANGYISGFWEFVYGINEHFYVGVSTLVPAAIMGAMARGGFQWEVAEGVHLGGGVFAGFTTLFVDADLVFDPVYYALGFHTAATFTFGRHTLNVGVAGVEAGIYADSGDDKIRTFLVPFEIGYRFAFHSRWSFLTEMFIPIVPEKFDDWRPYDTLPVMLLVGFRGHGETIFGDVGLAYPIASWYYKQDIWHYTPIGVPYFTIGFHW